MHTLGKVVILLLAIGAFLFQGCKKDAVSNTDRIKGVWRMESSFWDKDSNGLDSGDEVYMVKPSDTILWNFLGSGTVEYYINNKFTHRGTWNFAIFNTNPTTDILIFDSDFEFGEYSYKVQILNNKDFIIYTRKQIVKFSSVFNEWWGFKLSRQYE